MSVEYAGTKCAWSSRWSSRHMTEAKKPIEECEVCKNKVVKTTHRRFADGSGLVPTRLNKIWDKARLRAARSHGPVGIIEVNGKLKMIWLGNVGSSYDGSGAQPVVEACGAVWHGYLY